MQPVPIERTQTQILVNEFIRSVYNWMAIGLGPTGLMAFYVSNSALSSPRWSTFLCAVPG